MDPFLLSFGVIFLAELGDKSQLMAMAFATRYRPLTVLVAVTARDPAGARRLRRRRGRCSPSRCPAT